MTPRASRPPHPSTQLSLVDDAPATLPEPPPPSGEAIERILEGLNDEQRAAVTHGEGPLLVIAGAGTGKTQVITRRIAWLIATRRARPEQILALTFTDKAAAEMESRVDVLVPYGYVGATIGTFHAFCDRLVRDHAIELGLTSQLRVDTPAEILVFLRERVLEFELDRYRPIGRPDTHLRALVSVFDRARDEDVTPERYLVFANQLLADAGNDPEKLDRAAAELEKGRAYAYYQQLLLQHGRVDFGAQISLALRLLRERAYLRRELNDRYRYLLVDEFQDTNHVQFELVKMLAGTGRTGPNLTVVGDDDQSIYRFRGAKAENLLGFIEAFPDTTIRVLKHNYRSGQRILDASHRLIRHNDPDRLEARANVDKRLVARPGVEGAVEHWSFATASDEADAVAADIAETLERGERRAADLAVLARAHSHLDPFAVALKGRGVRFRRVDMRGLYSRAEVLVCLNVLRTVADPNDGTSAYYALGDPLFGADPVDLATIGAESQRTNRPFLRLAEVRARSSAATDTTREAVSRFVDLHARLCELAVRRSTSDVLYEFVSASGLLGRLAAEDSAEAIEKVQNLNKLFRIAQRIGSLLRHDRVGPFMQHLDLLIEMGDDPAAAEVELDEDAVQLLTAHNAKGLEFPVVYVVQCAAGRFPVNARTNALELPDELVQGGRGSEDHLREERRLFYVSMTRARDRLVLCHSADYGGGRRLAKPSPFVLEALALPSPPKAAMPAHPLESIARYAPTAESSPPEILPIPDDQPLEISHQKIDDFLTCPLKYRYAHIAQVPLGSDPQYMYGIAIHHAVRVYHQHRMKGHPIAVADVIAAFESAWSSEGFYSREHEELRQEQGRETLRKWIAREEASKQLPLAIEREFKFRLSPLDVVVGRWDRIDERDGQIVLVDYKTADIDDQQEADERAKRSLKSEQLGLYALAYREMTGAPPARVELNFIGAGIAGRAIVQPDHLDKAERRAREAAAGIRKAQFPAAPDPRSCNYCPYARFCIHSVARNPGGAA